MTICHSRLSLYDMLKFYADYFVRACVRLQRLQLRMVSAENWQTDVEHELIMVQRECKHVGFESLNAQAQRIINKLKGAIVPQGSADAHKSNVATLLRELGDAIEHELQSHLFLHVSLDKKEKYNEEDLPLFGEEVQSQFPEATHDIAEGGRCFALERWDACVHHLMLVTEIAMRKWAKDFNLQPRNPIELEDMQAILREAEKKHVELANKPRAERDRDLKYLAETSAQFGFIKDAWRLHSAHGRERYDERRATNIMNHLEEFMRLLASRPPRSL